MPPTVCRASPVPRGTLKSGTRNLKSFDHRRGRAVHVQLAGPAGNKALMTSPAPQMMVKPCCLRSLCAVDDLLNNSMSSDDLELCSFATPLCLEPHCVLDAPLCLSLKARSVKDTRGHQIALALWPYNLPYKFKSRPGASTNLQGSPPLRCPKVVAFV